MNDQARQDFRAEMFDALITCEAVLRVLPNVTTNNGGTTATVSTRIALEKARAALHKVTQS